MARRKSKNTNRPLSDREKKQLTGPTLATPFDAYDRLFPDFRNGDVFTVAWDTRRLKEMLERSGKARSVEQVLTLPLRSAPWEIQGDGPAADLVRDNLGPLLGRVIDQMTTACTYRKAYFELVWTIRDGHVVYDDIAWRPPAACEAGFDAKTGKPRGFRQRIAHPGGTVLRAEGKNTLPGYVHIPAQRAFIYTHGIHREPVLGVSDMDVAYWCYETGQKILFLWFQYLERQSLPNAIVYGSDPVEAEENAEVVAEMKAGGVIGLQRPPDPQAKAFEILESSGKGADQFIQAVRYLDEMMVASVLAGFTELATAASGTGSYALSADQSEFFLASRQAVADEMADAINHGLIKPLVTYNFGADTECPRVVIGPLSQKDTDRALTMLNSIITATQLNVPGSFVDELVKRTAAYLGLDANKVAEQIDRFAAQRAKDEEVKRQQAQALAAAQAQGGMGTPRPAPPGTPAPAAKIGNAVQAAAAMVAQHEQDQAQGTRGRPA